MSKVPHSKSLQIFGSRTIHFIFMPSSEAGGIYIHLSVLSYHIYRAFSLPNQTPIHAPNHIWYIQGSNSKFSNSYNYHSPYGKRYHHIHHIFQFNSSCFQFRTLVGDFLAQFEEFLPAESVGHAVFLPLGLSWIPTLLRGVVFLWSILSVRGPIYVYEIVSHSMGWRRSSDKRYIPFMQRFSQTGAPILLR